MPQPAIDHHLIVLHQGGPKRVERRGGSAVRSVDVQLNAITAVESGSIYRWHTQGPIAFTHLYVEPARFAGVVEDVLDRDAHALPFAECLRLSDPQVQRLFQLILESRNDPDWSAVADYYLDALLMRLAVAAGRSATTGANARVVLTTRTVSRVREFIRSNIGERISLGDLAKVAGYSRFHFVRAFKISTGQTPYAFLLDQRIDHACGLLRTVDLSIADVARMAGFASHAHFSASFRAATGQTPAAFRSQQRLAVASG